MASRALDRLLDNLRVRLPGALDSTIRFELFAALDEFFTRSTTWSSDLTFAVTTTGKSYQLHPPVGARIHLLRTVQDADEGYHSATLGNNGLVVLLNYPQIAQTYSADVVLTVADPVTRAGDPVVPDWVYADHGETVLHGVLARMMSQPAKPYTSTQLAAFHARAFRSGISEARIRADREGLYRGQTWRYPQTFARRRR